MATSVRKNFAWWPKPQAREGPGLKPLAPGPKPLVEHADQGAQARLSSRIGHVCNNNAVLVLHSPGNMASCADWFPTQQLKTAKLLSPGSLAWTNLVALVGLVPAAENPQRLGFRLSRFVRLCVGGLSRRLLSYRRTLGALMVPGHFGGPQLKRCLSHPTPAPSCFNPLSLGFSIVGGLRIQGKPRNQRGL